MTDLPIKKSVMTAFSVCNICKFFIEFISILPLGPNVCDCYQVVKYFKVFLTYNTNKNKNYQISFKKKVQIILQFKKILNQSMFNNQFFLFYFNFYMQINLKKIYSPANN